MLKQSNSSDIIHHNESEQPRVQQSLQVWVCSFFIHVKQATMAIKFPCEYFLQIKNKNHDKSTILKGSNRVNATNSVASFDQSLNFEIQVLYDTKNNQFIKKQIILLLQLVSVKRPDQPKPVGRYTIDLAEVINEQTLKQQQQHKLQYCSVSASMTFSAGLIDKKISDKPVAEVQEDRSHFHSYNSRLNHRDRIPQKSKQYDQSQTKRMKTDHLDLDDKQKQKCLHKSISQNSPKKKLPNLGVEKLQLKQQHDIDEFKNQYSQILRNSRQQQKRIWEQEKNLLNQQLLRQKQETSRFKQKSENLQQKLYEIYLKLTDVESKLEKMTNTLHQHDKNYEQALRKLQLDSKQKIDNLQSQLTLEKQNKKVLKQGIEQIKQQQTCKVASLQNTIKNLQKQIEQLETNTKQKQGQLSVAYQQNITLQEQLDLLSGSEQQVNNLKDMLQQKNQQIARLINKGPQYDKQYVNGLQQQVIKLYDEKQALQKIMLDKQNQWSHQLKQKEQEIQKLKDQINNKQIQQVFLLNKVNSYQQSNTFVQPSEQNKDQQIFKFQTEEPSKQEQVEIRILKAHSEDSESARGEEYKQDHIIEPNAHQNTNAKDQKQQQVTQKPENTVQQLTQQHVSPQVRVQMLQSQIYELSEELQKIQSLCQSIEKKRETQAAQYQSIISNLQLNIQSLIESNQDYKQKVKILNDKQKNMAQTLQVIEQQSNKMLKQMLLKEERISDLQDQLRMLRDVLETSFMEESKISDRSFRSQIKEVDENFEESPRKGHMSNILQSPETKRKARRKKQKKHSSNTKDNIYNKQDAISMSPIITRPSGIDNSPIVEIADIVNNNTKEQANNKHMVEYEPDLDNNNKEVRRSSDLQRPEDEIIKHLKKKISSLKELEKETKDIKLQNIRLRKQVEQLNQKLANSDQIQQKVNHAQQENPQQNPKNEQYIKQLEQQVNNLSDKVEQLEEELFNRESNQNTKDSTINNLQEELECVRGVLTMFNIDPTAPNKKQQQANKEQTDKQGVAKEDAKKLAMDIQSKYLQEIDVLKANIKDLTQRIQELQEINKQLEQQNSTLNKKNNQKQEQSEKQQEKDNQNQQQLKKLQNENEDLSNTIKQLQNSVQILKTQQNVAQQQLHEETNKAQDLAIQNNKNKQEIQELNQQIKKFARYRQTKEQELTSMEKNKKEAEQSVNSLSQQLKYMQEQNHQELQEKQQEIMRLNGQLKTLEVEHEAVIEMLKMHQQAAGSQKKIVVDEAVSPVIVDSMSDNKQIVSQSQNTQNSPKLQNRYSENQYIEIKNELNFYSQELQIFTKKYQELEAEHTRLKREYQQLQYQQLSPTNPIGSKVKTQSQQQAPEQHEKIIQQLKQQLAFARQSYGQTEQEMQSIKKQLQRENKNLIDRISELQEKVVKLAAELEQKNLQHMNTELDLQIKIHEKSQQAQSSSQLKKSMNASHNSLQNVGSTHNIISINSLDIVPASKVLKQLLNGRSQRDSQQKQQIFTAIAQLEQHVYQVTINNKDKSIILEKCRLLSMELSKYKTQIMKATKIDFTQKSELLKTLKPFDAAIKDIIKSAQIYCESLMLNESEQSPLDRQVGVANI